MFLLWYSLVFVSYLPGEETEELKTHRVSHVEDEEPTTHKRCPY